MTTWISDGQAAKEEERDGNSTGCFDGLVAEQRGWFGGDGVSERRCGVAVLLCCCVVGRDLRLWDADGQ